MGVQVATRTRAKSGRADARSLYEGRWGSPALGDPAKVSRIPTGPVGGTGSGWTRGSLHCKSSRARVRKRVGS
jgi:hypothetical protein